MKIEGRRPEPPVRSAERSVKDEGKGFEAMLAAFARTAPTAAPIVRGDARRGRAEGARAPAERPEERDVEQTRGERETGRGDSPRAEASDRGRGSESTAGRTHDAREMERAERDRERALDRAAAGAETAEARRGQGRGTVEGTAPVADGEPTDTQDELARFEPETELQSGSSEVAGVTSEVAISAWMLLDEHSPQAAPEHLRRAGDASVAHRSAGPSLDRAGSPMGLVGTASAGDLSASHMDQLDVAGAAMPLTDDATGGAPRVLQPVDEGATSIVGAMGGESGEGATSFGDAAPGEFGDAAPGESGDGAPGQGGGKGGSKSRSPDGAVSTVHHGKLASPHLAPESSGGASAALRAGLYSREGGATGLVAAGDERRAAKASSEPSLTNLTQTATATSVTRGAPSATDVATQQPNVGEALARAGSQLVHEDSTIRLTHPELGRVSLQLDVDTEVLEVRAVTESALAASLLAESEESLRRDLARHGVELRRLKVQREADGEGQPGRSGRDDRERPDDEGSSPRRRLRERG